MEALKSGKLRCMRESRIDPSERELVPASFWQGLKIHVEPDRGLIQIQVDRRSQGKPRAILGNSMTGSIMSGSRTSISSGHQRKPIRRLTEMSPRRKPGPTPKELEVTRCRRSDTGFEIEGKQPPPGFHFADFCRDKLDYVPDMSAIQKLLKQLL